MEAVKSICAFKLNDKLPPLPLLREYVEGVRMTGEICRSQMTPDEKDMAVNGKIAELRAAFQCMKDYNLESEYSKTVENQIVQLEVLKKKWRSSAPKVEQEERKRKNPCPSSIFCPEVATRKSIKNKNLFQWFEWTTLVAVEDNYLLQVQVLQSLSLHSQHLLHKQPLSPESSQFQQQYASEWDCYELNMLNTGGGVKSLVYGVEGNSVQIGEKGTGEMRVFASEKPLGCRIDGSDVAFEYEENMVRVHVLEIYMSLGYFSLGASERGTS
ncbi:hypothetical protein ACLB2K_053943 [Fragaria x ananassa]